MEFTLWTPVDERTKVLDKMIRYYAELEAERMKDSNGNHWWAEDDLHAECIALRELQIRLHRDEIPEALTGFSVLELRIWFDDI